MVVSIINATRNRQHFNGNLRKTNKYRSDVSRYKNYINHYSKIC